MKKKLAVLLCALSVMTFAACGAQGPDEMPVGEVTEAVADVAEAANEVEEVAEEVVEEVADVAEEVVEEVAEEENGDSEISLGLNDGSKYENTYFGIGCAFDEEWTMENEEQILARNQIAKDLVDEKFASAFESAAVITDMVAVNNNGVDTVNAGIEKLQGGAMLIDEKTYIEISAPQVTEMFESMGLENIVATPGEIEFCGNTHSCLDIEADYNGNAVFEKLVVVKNKNYILCITACTWNENKIDSILDKFYAAE